MTYTRVYKFREFVVQKTKIFSPNHFLWFAAFTESDEEMFEIF